MPYVGPLTRLLGHAHRYRPTQEVSVGRLLGLSTASLMIALVACGGGASSTVAGQGDGDPELAAAIADAVISNAASDELIGRPEADCFGEEIVISMGSTRLREIGLGVEQVTAGAGPADVVLSEDDAELMATALAACVDFATFFVGSLAGTGLSDESATCISEQFDDELVVQISALALLEPTASPLDDPEIGSRFFTMMASCLTFDDLQDLGNG